MKNKKGKDFFETTDIALANTIYYFGGKIEEINKANPSRAVFVFKRSEELGALVQAFWTHSLQVEPLSYFNSLKEIKTQLHQVSYFNSPKEVKTQLYQVIE